MALLTCHVCHVCVSRRAGSPERTAGCLSGSRLGSSWSVSVPTSRSCPLCKDAGREELVQNASAGTCACAPVSFKTSTARRSGKDGLVRIGQRGPWVGGVSGLESPWGGGWMRAVISGSPCKDWLGKHSLRCLGAAKASQQRLKRGWHPRTLKCSDDVGG